MLNIFISYSSQNRPSITSLAADLQEMGYTVWFDRELTGGHQWWEAILEQIRRCDLFIFALTPAALHSGPCQREYEYAHALHKRILPVWLEEVDIRILPAPLQVIQVVDYRERTPAAILKLTRACIQLPPAQPLPDKMPPEPEVPLSPLAHAAERVNGPTLDLNAQRLLVSDLRELLADPSTAQSARQLLEKFAARDDLFGRVEKEIGTLLDIRTSVHDDPPVVSVPQSSPPPPSIPAPLPIGQNATIRYPGTVTFYGSGDSAHNIAFSPDGRYLLTCDGTARLWDILTQDEVRTFKQDMYITDGVISHDGQFALTNGSFYVNLWNVQTGQLVRQYVGQQRSANRVIFSDDNRYILVGGYDGSVTLFETASGSIVWLAQGNDKQVWVVRFVKNSQTVIAGTEDGYIKLLDSRNGKQLKSARATNYIVADIAVDPSGRTMVVNTGLNISLWDVAKLKLITDFPSEYDNGVALSPDGRWMVTGTTASEYEVRLWNLSRRKIIYTFTIHQDKVERVAFAPNGRAIAAGFEDCTARLWSLDGII